MNLQKYHTKEKMYKARQLTVEEYNGFLSTESDDVASTEDVIVPDKFAQTHTSEKKIRNAIMFYHEHGYFDKPVTVIPETNEQGKRNKLILIDGLSRYLAAIRLKVDIINVKYIGIEDVDYILN